MRALRVRQQVDRDLIDQMAGNLCRQQGSHAVAQAIVTGQLDCQHEVVAAKLSNRLADFHQQTTATGQSGAVVVQPQVCARRQKLVKQVSVPRRQLHPCVAAALQSPCGFCCGLYKCLQLRRRHFLRHGIEQVVRQCRSSSQTGHSTGYAPGAPIVLNLGQQMAILTADSLGKTG